MVEENSLLDSIEFKDMTTNQKEEVLSKIIYGRIDPYRTQKTLISMKLSANSSKPILWTGEILDADYGLIKISTTVQGDKWDDFRSLGDYGVVYYGKDLFLIVSEKTIDSLVLATKPAYQ